MGDIDKDGMFLLDLLNAEEKEKFLLNTTKVKYKKGECIVKKDEFVTHIVYIVKGFVKIHTDIQGKEIILNLKGPKTIAGLSTMITCEKHPFSLTALEDSIIHLISINVIQHLIETNGSFATQIIGCINATNLEYIQHNLLALTQNNIHGKLANTLLYMMDRVFYSPKFEVMLSRAELAQFSKISRENVIKTLYEFDSEGLIRLNGKQIEIINPLQLRKLADFG